MTEQTGEPSNGNPGFFMFGLLNIKNQIWKHRYHRPRIRAAPATITAASTAASWSQARSFSLSTITNLI